MESFLTGPRRTNPRSIFSACSLYLFERGHVAQRDIDVRQAFAEPDSRPGNQLERVLCNGPLLTQTSFTLSGAEFFALSRSGTILKLARMAAKHAFLALPEVLGRKSFLLVETQSSLFFLLPRNEHFVTMILCLHNPVARNSAINRNH